MKKKNFSFGAKLIGGFLVVVALTTVASGITWWNVNRMANQSAKAQEDLRDALKAEQIASLTSKLYQNQADLIINKEMKTIGEFETTMKEYNTLRKEFAPKLDTAEEKASMAQIDKANDEFDKNFHEKIATEIKRQMGKPLQKADSDTDKLVQAITERADKLTAAAQSNPEKLHLAAALKIGALQLYRNQADLVINEDLNTIKEFAQSAKELEDAIAKARQIAGAGQERQWIDEIAASTGQMKTLFNDRVVPEVRISLEDRINKYDGESDTQLSTEEENMNKILAASRDRSDAMEKEANRVCARAKQVLLWSSLTVLVLGLLLGLTLTRMITAPIDRIIAALTRSSTQLTGASNQVAESSQQMAAGASEQASSLEEISSSLEEMSSMTGQNAENAREAAAMAGTTREATDKSKLAMTRMAQAIEKIKTSSDKTARIIKTIDEIAFQTNLLALNAAVEAARAGEAGKGFAVVAEEVRSLAQRSAEAAKNTAALIEESQSNSEQGVSATREVGDILEQIAAAIMKLTLRIDEVTSASQQQAQGIEQINTAVAQMDKLTQSNAANAEESASASEELNAQARELNEMVKTLITVVRGGVKGAAEESAKANPQPESPEPYKIALEKRATPAARKTEAAPAKAPAKAPRRQPQLAASTPAKRIAHKPRPEDVIPLDDSDLSEF